MSDGSNIQKVLELATQGKCRIDGIGSHGRLKSDCRKACRFESDIRYFGFGVLTTGSETDRFLRGNLPYNGTGSPPISTNPNAQPLHSTHCRNHFNRHWLILP